MPADASELGIDHVDIPFVDDGETLPHDPVVALDKLTQLNGSSPSAGANACGAVSLVAAVLITQGYAGLAKLVEKLQDELADDTREELEELAARVENGGEDATYGALADFAIRLHRRYRGMDGGMAHDKLLHLMERAGFSPPRSSSDQDLGRTLGRKGALWPAKISLHGDEGDHWILVGRDARSLYVFDPYPRSDGSQIIRQSEPDFSRYTKAIGQDEDGRNTIGFLPPD